jgi:hypothetical protein
MIDIQKAPEEDSKIAHPAPVYVRLFVSLFEDIEDQDPIEEHRWKNYDGYHFVSRVVKPKSPTSNLDPATHLRKNLKYAWSVPAHLINTLSELIKYLCEAFCIPDCENYTIVLDDDTLVFDIKSIQENDKIKLVRKDKLIKISQLSEKIRKWHKLISEFSTDYMDYVKKHPCILSLPKEWKNLETVDLSSSSKNSRNSATIEPVKRAPVVIPNLNQRVTVFDYNNELFYETPAFQDFMNEGTNWMTREDLQAKVKTLAAMRGFKVVQPNGEVLNQKKELKNVFQCLKYGKNRKNSTQRRTGCPFTLIYKKSERSQSYQLAKFRSAHNHPLDEVTEDYQNSGYMHSGIGNSMDDDYGDDYNLSKSMNIKQDVNFQQNNHEIKREDTEDYSLDDLPSNETTGPKDSNDLNKVPDMEKTANSIGKFMENGGQDAEMKTE